MAQSVCLSDHTRAGSGDLSQYLQRRHNHSVSHSSLYAERRVQDVGTVFPYNQAVRVECPSRRTGSLFAGHRSLGRDMFSRVIYGARLSLSIGLVGVALSLILGILLGGLSGYYGGTVDNMI